MTTISPFFAGVPTEDQKRRASKHAETAFRNVTDDQGRVLVNGKLAREVYERNAGADYNKADQKIITDYFEQREKVDPEFALRRRTFLPLHDQMIRGSQNAMGSVLGGRLHQVQSRRQLPATTELLREILAGAQRERQPQAQSRRQSQETPELFERILPEAQREKQPQAADVSKNQRAQLEVLEQFLKNWRK